MAITNTVSLPDASNRPQAQRAVARLDRFAMETAAALDRCRQGDLLWYWLGTPGDATTSSLIVGRWGDDPDGSAFRERVAAIRSTAGSFGVLEFGPTGYVTLRNREQPYVRPAELISDLADWVMDTAPTCPAALRLLGTTFWDQTGQGKHLDHEMLGHFWEEVGEHLGFPLESVPALSVAAALRYAKPQEPHWFAIVDGHLLLRPQAVSGGISDFDQDRLRLSGPADHKPRMATTGAFPDEGVWYLVGTADAPNVLKRVDAWVRSHVEHVPELAGLRDARLLRRSGPGKIVGHLQRKADWDAPTSGLRPDAAVLHHLDQTLTDGKYWFWYCRDSGNGAPAMVVAANAEEAKRLRDPFLHGGVPEKGSVVGQLRVKSNTIALRCEEPKRTAHVATFLQSQQGRVPAVCGKTIVRGN